MKKIVIVGGGTSGLIAAAMMDNYWKDNINITLIYDPDNKNISVGEGTTPGFVDLFEETLGHTRQDSIKKLDATIKLGILFKNWIPDEEYYHGFSQVNIEHVDDNYSCIHSLLNDCYDGGINFNHANGFQLLFEQ